MSLRTARPPIWLLMIATVAAQLALTIYLPALPSIAAYFNVAYGTVLLTLSVYLLAFAFAQLAVGPLSDRIGRRPVLLGSLAAFVISSVLCALAVSIEMLIGARLLQACCRPAAPAAVWCWAAPSYATVAPLRRRRVRWVT